MKIDSGKKLKKDLKKIIRRHRRRMAKSIANSKRVSAEMRKALNID